MSVQRKFNEAPPAMDPVAEKLFQMLMREKRTSAKLRAKLYQERQKLKLWRIRGLMKKWYGLKAGEAR